MLAVFVNALTVILGSTLGMLLRKWLKEEYTKTIIFCMGICVMVIGITGAVATSNIVIVIVCLVLGTILGELVKLEKRLDGAGEWLQKTIPNSGSRFTAGFVSASRLYVHYGKL